MLVERGKFRTGEKYFLEWSVDDGMKTVFGWLRSRYRCGSRSKLFERSEFLIDTSQKKCLRVCPCFRLILVLVWKTLILVLVRGTYCVPATYTVNRQVVIIIAKVWPQKYYNIPILRTIFKTITLIEGGKT